MPDRGSVPLPAKVFLYTTDQIAMMVSIPEKKLVAEHLHLRGVDMGRRPKGKMLAIDISTTGEPDWRVTESEYVGWARSLGIQVYERGWDMAVGN